MELWRGVDQPFEVGGYMAAQRLAMESQCENYDVQVCQEEVERLATGECAKNGRNRRSKWRASVVVWHAACTILGRAAPGSATSSYPPSPLTLTLTMSFITDATLCSLQCPLQARKSSKLTAPGRPPFVSCFSVPVLFSCLLVVLPSLTRFRSLSC